MASTLREEIQVLFNSSVTSDEKLVEEITSICQIYNLSPQNLLYKWEAINFNWSATHSEISPFSMGSVAALKAQLQRELAKESGKKTQRAMPPGNTAVVNRSRIPANMARVMNMGAKVGVIQVKEEQSGAGPSKVVFKGPKMDGSSRKDRAYRYMYEKISERSEALDDRIDEFGELVRERYKIAELGDPTSSTDEEITIVGRITCDSDSSGSASKLTEATITIESSRMLSSGSRIPLRFDPSFKIRGGAQGAGSVGLFPGAMVALRGKNGGGGWFLVNEILVMPPLKAPSLGQPKLKVDPGVGNEPLSVYIVCGPYTLDADLSYKPWHAFLKTIKTSKPTVVLLAGPFVDVAHPKIKNGDVDTTPSNLFRKQFLEPLRNFLDSSPGSIVLILPSVRDLISRQAVFPQSELEPEFRLDPRIHLLPNPALFSLNDIKFAMSSVDVLFHLRKEEFIKRGEEVDSIPPSSVDDVGTDAMANTCRHLLQQRSFYPIFPVPLDVSHDVNLSVTHWDGLQLSDDNDAPDVLIVPSRLKQFSKIVHSTTVLNPSFLTKGTYAVVNIAGGAGVELKEQLNSEIVKIEQ